MCLEAMEWVLCVWSLWSGCYVFGAYGVGVMCLEPVEWVRTLPVCVAY